MAAGIAESGVRGQRQTAYQVLVATSEAALRKDQGDLWDSGKVGSDQSLHVVYAGEPLASEQACWWKVRVWDQAGRSRRGVRGHAGRWDCSVRRIGKRSGSVWTSMMINSRRRKHHPTHPTIAAFRRGWCGENSKWHNKVVRATAYVSGLGFSELYLNGRKVDTRVIDPTHSRYDKRAMYVTFDVTETCGRGETLRESSWATAGSSHRGSLFRRRPRRSDFRSSCSNCALSTSMEARNLLSATKHGRLRTRGRSANSEFDGEEMTPAWSSLAGIRRGSTIPSGSPRSSLLRRWQTHCPNVGADARYRDAQAGGDSESPAGH